METILIVLLVLFLLGGGGWDIRVGGANVAASNRSRRVARSKTLPNQTEGATGRSHLGPVLNVIQISVHAKSPFALAEAYYYRKSPSVHEWACVKFSVYGNSPKRSSTFSFGFPSGSGRFQSSSKTLCALSLPCFCFCGKRWHPRRWQVSNSVNAFTRRLGDCRSFPLSSAP